METIFDLINNKSGLLTQMYPYTLLFSIFFCIITFLFINYILFIDIERSDFHF